MKLPQRLDTSFKRGSFLVMIGGASILVVSLIVWTQQSSFNRVFYSVGHYEWVPDDGPLSFNGFCCGAGGLVPRGVDRYYWLDRACVVPFVRARTSELERTLPDHGKSKPESGGQGFDQPFSLKVRQAKEALTNLGRNGFCEGQLRAIASEASIQESVAAIIMGRPSRSETRTDGERFRDTLYDSLGLTSFPAASRAKIFEQCAKESTMRAVRVRTTYNSKLGNWLGDHLIPFILGLFMGIAGFLGSFGHRTSSIVINGTVGRLISWVRAGDARPGDRSAPPSPTATSADSSDTSIPHDS